MIILVCGAEGSGKTTLARPLANLLGAEYINKDSHKNELKGFIDGLVASGKTVVVDKRCSTTESIDYLSPDFVVWLDTVKSSKYKPRKYDYHVSEWFNDTHIVLVEVVKKYMERGYHNV